MKNIKSKTKVQNIQEKQPKIDIDTDIYIPLTVYLLFSELNGYHLIPYLCMYICNLYIYIKLILGTTNTLVVGFSSATADARRQ